MLPVRSCRPIGLSNTLGLPTEPAITVDAEPSNHASTQISEGVHEAMLPTLVTPRLAGPSGKRIRYAVLEWNPLLDSSNIEAEDWIRIATEIELNYSAFDAFVVLHGTDTMAYTSSALSFILEDLGKTVIVTGAQIPLAMLRNDAIDNLLGALCIAGHYIIPEVCLFFDSQLFRGNRVSKMSSHDLNAFASPNFPPLVEVGIDITVNWNDVIRQTSLKRFRVHRDMEAQVATLRLFPGITAATFKAFLAPPVRGVILETFGAGNAPQRPELMHALHEACNRGVVVVSISQCAKGAVSSAYATGQSLINAGVVPGGDMTPECALAKLSYLLSKPELSVLEVRTLMGTPLRGELSHPSKAPRTMTNDDNLDNIGGVLSRVVQLSMPSTARAQQNTSLDDIQPDAEGSAAPWTATASEVATTEGALLCFLVHLAAAKDDVASLDYCLGAESDANSSQNQQYRNVAGGMVNWVNPASGQSPLQVAAINGSLKCVKRLLQAGALVHLRDIMGHTALFYAARQNHEEIVSVLLSAGANLGGADEGVALSLLHSAVAVGDEIAVALWEQVGVKVPATP
ncbi:unnamed protein product [Peniophora sp. CBMAI 1063]|nr:unnamed protein product [Peniophora sp. CBMAI 1063]